ncbi:MAG TPA: hypothetical protein VFI02_10815 [Armatimonadota bacterium]|nr:hypothetical protein [Armatimonadota bacterium]
MDSRKKIYAIGLLILLLAVIPYSRNLLIAQVAQAINLKYGQLGTYSVIKPTELKVARNASDALVLGYRHRLSRNPTFIDPYLQLTARFPNDPALCANMLKYSFGAESVKSNARAIEQVIRRGQKLEPDNGYFDCFEAALRFKQKRDAEGLAAVHRAAGKKHINSHQAKETVAIMRNSERSWPFPLGWVNPVNRISSAYSLLFPHSLYFRSMARSAASYEEHAVKRGNVGDAAQTMMDTVKIGGMMRDEGESFISALVGMSIQRIGINGVHKGLANHAFAGDAPGTAAVAAVQTLAPNALDQAEWGALSKNLARSDGFRKRSRSYVNHIHSPGFIAGFIASTVWFSFAGYMLLMGLGTGVVYLAASVILRKRNITVKDVGPGKLSVGLLAVLPSAAGLMALAGMAIAQMFLAVQGQPGSLPALPVVFTAILILTIIAAARTRIRPELRRPDVFLARLRTGSAYAAKAFLVLYVVAMVINIPATAWAYHKLNQVALNEVQMIWEYPPAK